MGIIFTVVATTCIIAAACTVIAWPSVSLAYGNIAIASAIMAFF